MRTMTPEDDKLIADLEARSLSKLTLGYLCWLIRRLYRRHAWEKRRADRGPKDLWASMFRLSSELLDAENERDAALAQVAAAKAEGWHECVEAWRAWTDWDGPDPQWINYPRKEEGR